MLVSKAARRYATALLGLAREKDVVEETLEDILLIKNTLDGSRDLLLFLRSPIIRPDQKVKALEAVFADKVSELVHRFITLIAKKNRENLIDQIAEAFIEIYNKYAGIINAEVFTAKKLDDEQIKHVKSALEKHTGKKVNITTRVQKELRGGIAVKIDDTVIDGTIKHKLEQLEDEFLSTTKE